MSFIHRLVKHVRHDVKAVVRTVEKVAKPVTKVIVKDVLHPIEKGLKFAGDETNKYIVPVLKKAGTAALNQKLNDYGLPPVTPAFPDIQSPTPPDYSPPDITVNVNADAAPERDQNAYDLASALGHRLGAKLGAKVSKDFFGAALRGLSRLARRPGFLSKLGKISPLLAKPGLLGAITTAEKTLFDFYQRRRIKAVKAGGRQYRFGFSWPTSVRAQPGALFRGGRYGTEFSKSTPYGKAAKVRNAQHNVAAGLTVTGKARRSSWLSKGPPTRRTFVRSGAAGLLKQPKAPKVRALGRRTRKAPSPIAPGATIARGAATTLAPPPKLPPPTPNYGFPAGILGKPPAPRRTRYPGRHFVKNFLLPVGQWLLARPPRPRRARKLRPQTVTVNTLRTVRLAAASRKVKSKKRRKAKRTAHKRRARSRKARTTLVQLWS